MIDIALLREQPDLIRASQRARGERVELVDEAISADSRRRAAVAAFDSLRNEQKTLGKDIGPLQGAVKKGDTSKQAELDELMAKATKLSADVTAAEEALRVADTALEAVLKEFSNVVHPAVPVGGEDDFVVLEHVGTPRDFAAEGLAVRDHIEIGTALQAIDIEERLRHLAHFLAAEIAGKNYNRPIEMYLFSAVIYFAICIALSTLVKRLQKKIAVVR